jgi:hypothetical protein
MDVIDFQAGASHSEQQLLDCASPAWGSGGACGGGFMSEALNWLASGHPALLESAYPYRGDDTGDCKKDASKASRATVSNVYLVKGEDGIEAAVALKGPVAFSICTLAGTKKFNDYTSDSGVIDGECGGDDDCHAMGIVGFTSDYWIVRNSWGSDWGDDGYVYLKRGPNAKCKIDGGYIAEASLEKPTPKPTPQPPLYPTCTEGKYDWAGKADSSHASCESLGCDYDTCQQKMDDGLAISHCYTQAQIDEGKVGNGETPRGCNYGSQANTCAFDAENRCVYSGLDDSLVV